MIRSLAGIIVAVVISLTAAKFFENIGLSFVADLSPDEAASAQSSIDWDRFGSAYKIWLLGGWFVASFIAGAVALMIARRWAPVGALASAAVALNVVISLSAAGAGPVFWMLSLLIVGVAGWAAQFIMKARSVYPAASQKKGLFDG